MVFYLICLCDICFPPKNPPNFWRFNTAAHLILFCTRYFGLGFWNWEPWAFLHQWLFDLVFVIEFELLFECMHWLGRVQMVADSDLLSAVWDQLAPKSSFPAQSIYCSLHFTLTGNSYLSTVVLQIARFLCHQSLLIEQQFIETTEPQNHFWPF